MSHIRPTTRVLAAAAGCTLAGLAGCAAPASDQQASWPPPLHAASDRMQAADTAAQQRDRALEDAGVTVLLDRPYH